MAISAFLTHLLASFAGVSGAQATTAWMALSSIPDRTHVPLQVTISAGTATVVINGRVNGAGSATVVLATLSASDIVMVPAGIEYSVTVTAATVATITVESRIALRLA